MTARYPSGDEYDDPTQLAADLDDDTPPPGWVLCTCEAGEDREGGRHRACGGYGWKPPTNSGGR